MSTGTGTGNGSLGPEPDWTCLVLDTLSSTPLPFPPCLRFPLAPSHTHTNTTAWELDLLLRTNENPIVRPCPPFLSIPVLPATKNFGNVDNFFSRSHRPSYNTTTPYSPYTHPCRPSAKTLCFTQPYLLSATSARNPTLVLPVPRLFTGPGSSNSSSCKTFTLECLGLE